MNAPRPRSLLLWSAFALAALLLALPAAGHAASATPAPVPLGFFGVAVHETTWTAADPDAEFRRMRVDGVESVTASIYWHDAQPYPDAASVPPERAAEFAPAPDGIPTTFVAADRLYAQAARNGLRVLPVINGAAPWARLDPERTWSPPADPEAYGRFVGLLVQRYGRGGTFWAAHPELPALPTRDWQIWNEPAGGQGKTSTSYFWDADLPFEPRYVAMLRASRAAARAADPQARTLIGGLLGRAWDSAEQMYAGGAQPYFDGIALHPYTRKPQDVVLSVRLVRRVMRAHGDNAKPIVLTEFGWPSSVGRVPANRGYGFEKTRRGQAAVIAAALPLLAKARKALRLTGVYWYTWAGRDTDLLDIFDYSGLRTVLPSGEVVPKPAEKIFRQTVRSLEGCAVAATKRPARCRR